MMHEHEIDYARAALMSIPSNLPRDQWHEIGRAALAAGLTIDDVDEWSATAGNYKGRHDVEAAFRNIKPDGGTGAGTLFYYAKQYGFDGIKKADSNQLSLTHNKSNPRKAVKQAEKYNASQVWEYGIAATPNEPYIKRKQGNPDGLRVYPDSAPPLVISGQNVAGYLMIPCWSGDNLQTLQFIPRDNGNKLNLPGASFRDGYFTVGDITSAQKIYLVEGVGQSWAVTKADPLSAAVVCFGAGRMETVAKAIRTKYPTACLVIVPDRGKERQAAEIAAAVVGQWVELPDDKPDNYDVNDFMQEFSIDELLSLLEKLRTHSMRFKLLSGDDLNKMPPMQWRIKGILPKEGTTAVFGPSGSGKTFLTIDMAYALASGGDWFGYKSKPCNVVYCALEGESGITNRVAAYRAIHDKNTQNIFFLVQSFNLLESNDIQDLAQAIKITGQNAQVVIVDTLNRAAPGADENDSKSMGNIIAACKQLQKLLGGLVIIVHHTGKDATKGLRGHSSLHAALDAAIEIRRDGDRREWLVAKSKDGQDGASHPFELQVVELGFDEDNEPITSCVVHPIREVCLRKTLPPKSGNQRIVWDALSELFRKAEVIRPEGAPDSLPQGKPCITLEAAIEKTRTKLVCDHKRKTERAQDAIRKLISRGLLCHEKGFLWCK